MRLRVAGVGGRSVGARGGDDEVTSEAASEESDEAEEAAAPSNAEVCLRPGQHHVVSCRRAGDLDAAGFCDARSRPEFGQELREHPVQERDGLVAGRAAVLRGRFRDHVSGLLRGCDGRSSPVGCPSVASGFTRREVTAAAGTLQPAGRLPVPGRVCRHGGDDRFRSRGRPDEFPRLPDLHASS